MFTYIAPRGACAASSALRITDTARVYRRPQVKPALTDFGLQPYIVTYRPSLSFYFFPPPLSMYVVYLLSVNICDISTHLLTPDGQG